MNKGSSSNYNYLVNRYFDHSITREELEELLALVRSGEYEDDLTEALHQQWQAAQTEKRETGIDWDNKLDMMLQQHRPPVASIRALRRRAWYRIAAAAMLLLFLGGGLYYIFGTSSVKVVEGSTTNMLAADTITLPPGTDGAVLTLANGEKIVLDSAGKGLISMQGATCVFNKGGAIRYDDADVQTSKEIIYNTLTTPRGKQFQLQLSDGTKVWLNASSSIRFPTAFTGDTRKVEITGEVYFEVAHIDGRSSPANAIPFFVAFKTPAGHSGEVQVLGTHFNINAYEDEHAVKTTLLEGKVRVAINGKTALLAPGQQAVVNHQGSMDTHEGVDLEAVVAWKNGYFSFSETDLATLMRQIARWYDVDIEYTGEIPKRKFGGEISRNSNAAQVLKIMEESEVHFKITGRKIIVLP